MNPIDDLLLRWSMVRAQNELYYSMQSKNNCSIFVSIDESMHCKYFVAFSILGKNWRPLIKEGAFKRIGQSKDLQALLNARFPS
jgi:hypothetical protein